MKKILSLAISTLILVGVGTYFIGVYFPFMDISSPPLQSYTLDNWYFLQNDSNEYSFDPFFIIGLNFSNNIENASVVGSISFTDLSTVYTFNITASQGNLTAYSVGVSFNDANSLQFWAVISTNISEHSYKFLYAQIRYKEDYSNGFFIAHPWDCWYDFETTSYVLIRIFV